MTEYCPVCALSAERGQSKDYDDKKQVRCRRCGQFEISGTALAMLGSRLKEDPLAHARLSHAIRSRTSQDNWLFISSTNLDELVRQPLPGIPQQLQHLALWLGAQLGEDRLGRTPTPWPETLAGIVGAANGERVQRLIDYAVKRGIVERDVEKDVLGLSPDGWAMIEPSKATAESNRQVRPTGLNTEIIRAHCNECGGERNAYKRASHNVNREDREISWSNTYDVLECCGCSSVSVRHIFWHSEWDELDADPVTGEPRLTPGVKVTYWPPPTKRKKPEWAENLDDDVLRRVVEEVYQALNGGMIILASIGTRTLIDRAMFLRVGDPKGGFAGKLNFMVEQGHIGKNEREILEAITDAGSAAAHRGFNPSASVLATIIETVENFLHREFVLKTAAGEVKTATPPRVTTVPK